MHWETKKIIIVWLALLWYSLYCSGLERNLQPLWNMPISLYKGILLKANLNSLFSIHSLIPSTQQVGRRFPNNHFFCTVSPVRNSLLKPTRAFVGMMLCVLPVSMCRFKSLLENGGQQRMKEHRDKRHPSLVTLGSPGLVTREMAATGWT